MALHLHALLLAALCAVIAHGAIRVPTQRQVVLVTSLLHHGKNAVGAAENAHIKRNLLSLEGDAVADSATASVVQDWSLVCKQLCGAGLGGEPCVPHCSVQDAPASALSTNAASVLGTNGELICADLCGLQLGDVNCHCANAVASNNLDTAPITSDFNQVCGTFCTHNSITLDGCSPCGIKAALMAAANDNSGVISTTPNWNELCVALCKTGDGGALCKCDLSPFFF